MKQISTQYINGKFVPSHGTAQFDLINPSTNAVIGRLSLADEQDTQDAIAAATEALKSFSKTTKQQRSDYLQQLHDAVMERADELIDAVMEEYGAPQPRAKGATLDAANNFLAAKEALQGFEFVRSVGKSRVLLEPVGVVGIITPWNSTYGFVCNKLAMAIATGCTTVIKPSEMSGIQVQLLTECLDKAGLPPGVFNIVTGLGDVVGAEITRNPHIAKISFTGSTVVGKIIARGAVDTMKRVTLELGGKSPNIILDDADLRKAVPLAVAAGFANSGQACIAGTRLLVPESRAEEIKALVKEAVAQVKVGPPHMEGTTVGPMVSKKQYERVQHYIQLGMEGGAEVLIGGIGHPEGLEAGNFVKPTVFVNVTNDMTIAQEEIFGPVISMLTYKTDEEAIAIANDTVYGLHAFVSGTDLERANRVASQIDAGRVLINFLGHDPLAPFGGFKQSGIGREYGVFGFDAYVEPKALLGDVLG
jgi:aldehyde dehydrogenase (NAD+)